jgi:hypothetical protein
VIGLIYESLSGCFWQWQCRRALISAAKGHKSWHRPVPSTANGPACNKKDLFKILLQWLLTSKDEGVRNAYAHIQRFQAEARLCAYSVVPLAVLCIAAGIKCDVWIAGLSLVMAILFAPCALFRERRRWIQAIATLSRLRPEDDPMLETVQKMLQDINKD